MAKPKDKQKTDFNKTAADGKPVKKKNRMKKLMYIGIGIFVLLIVIVFNFPRYGTINYGICRTYVELHEPYPNTINWLWAWEDQSSNMVYIGYKRYDPFGLESTNDIACTIHYDDKKNITLEKVDVNGKKRKYPQEDPEEIKKFNVGLGGLFAYPPSLIMPSEWANDIKKFR